ncbi:hypothetical protein [uncultured Methanomethylovorans sp.]|uniref:hypothetical protein n=1 Tax=uncultured Methanomethylovorans sp. TaxID=183759 RepID=UPI002AA8C037|nr:hypothetical protein [uncultured Methanomethylovorans sp.]
MFTTPNYLKYGSKVPVCLLCTCICHAVMLIDAILKANGFTKPESSPIMAPRENTACQVDNIETLVEDKLRAMMMKLLA